MFYSNKVSLYVYKFKIYINLFEKIVRYRNTFDLHVPMMNIFCYKDVKHDLNKIKRSLPTLIMNKICTIYRVSNEVQWI